LLRLNRLVAGLAIAYCDRVDKRERALVRAGA
jgi:hypothetical protein